MPRAARRQPSTAPSSPTLADLAARLGLDLSQLRADAARAGMTEEALAAYLVTTLGELAAGFRASLQRREAARSGALARACGVLGLRAGEATPDAVRRAYRRTVAGKRLHPDQGGDRDAFQMATEARDAALALVPAVAA